jgi:hypothetical protein
MPVINRKASDGAEASPEAIGRYLPGTPFHDLLQGVKARELESLTDYLYHNLLHKMK